MDVISIIFGPEDVAIPDLERDPDIKWNVASGAGIATPASTPS
jgi:hypothetical protein